MLLSSSTITLCLLLDGTEPAYIAVTAAAAHFVLGSVCEQMLRQDIWEHVSLHNHYLHCH